MERKFHSNQNKNIDELIKEFNIDNGYFLLFLHLFMKNNAFLIQEITRTIIKKVKKLKIMNIKTAKNKIIKKTKSTIIMLSLQILIQTMKKKTMHE